VRGVGIALPLGMLGLAGRRVLVGGGRSVGASTSGLQGLEMRAGHRVPAGRLEERPEDGINLGGSARQHVLEH